MSIRTGSIYVYNQGNMTQLLTTPSEHPKQENIKIAAQALRAGKLVAFPTETVYGLGANALDETAVRGIFSAKGRPSADPLIVHLTGVDQLPRVAHSVSPTALRLAEAFWPGPLTLILSRRPEVAPSVSAGLNTLAVRVPAHPVALALLRAADVPVAAPSANRFGHTSPTTAQHVLADLDGRVDVILDGGATPIGVESTVLDVSTNPPRILRPGGLTREQIESVIGPVSFGPQSETAEAGLPSPGLLKVHYAPRAELVLFNGENAPAAMLAALTEIKATGRTVGVLVTDEEAQAFESAGARVYCLGPGADLSHVARRLYAGMRHLDTLEVDVILAHDFGVQGLGLAIRDRLTKAASRVTEP